MLLASLVFAVPMGVVTWLVDPVTGQPRGLDVTGSVLLVPLLLGVLWWVWRTMDGMKLTHRMPFAWQMIGAAMFQLIRGAVLLGVFSAATGPVMVVMAFRAGERMPEELVVQGFGVLLGVGATFLLRDSAARAGVRG
jgi:hypothetical protein